MSTLAGTLALRNVEDVEALVRKVADDRLRFWGARLRDWDHEDLVSYLIGVAWELSERYDPTLDRNPNFAAYASRICTLRCADWFRQRFGDTRHGERPIVLSLDAAGATGGGTETGADGGGGRLVDALSSSEGDPARDRSPDLVGALQRRGGEASRPLEALGEQAPRRAARGDRTPAVARKRPAVPPTYRPSKAPPVCSACEPVFLAALHRAERLAPAAVRRSPEDVAAEAARRARAVKFAGEWVCPRCTTVPFPGGQILFLDQVYPNRASRRAESARRTPAKRKAGKP